MEKKEVLAHIAATIVTLDEQIDIKDVKPECSLMNDLGFDSLDKVELELKIEEHYGFRMLDEESMGIDTVDDLANVVMRHLSK